MTVLAFGPWAPFRTPTESLSLTSARPVLGHSCVVSWRVCVLTSCLHIKSHVVSHRVLISCLCVCVSVGWCHVWVLCPHVMPRVVSSCRETFSYAILYAPPQAAHLEFFCVFLFLEHSGPATLFAILTSVLQHGAEHGPATLF